LSKYLVTTDDGVAEVEEFENGIRVECLIEPSEAYLQMLADQPPKPPSPPTDIETLRLEQAQSNTEMVDLVMAMLGGV